jgi:glucose/arabinose dehydrogenase
VPSRPTPFRRRFRPRHWVAAALLLLPVLAACSSGAAGSTPTWVPQPDIGANINPTPELPGSAVPEPQPSAPNTPNPGGSPQAPGSAAPSPSANQDPAVVATKLNQPTGLVVLPDGTALVGERTTGRIYRVQPTAGQPATLVQTLAGVDGAGDGGLLDLALSPTFAQDGLIYAYLTTATDNRVVHFAVGSAPSPVITGIPKGKRHNAGRIAFDATGSLLTGTGDAAAVQNASSLAGKILRTTDIGRPAVDNPNPASIIYASGFSSVNGLCVDAQTGVRAAMSAGSPDELNLITAGGKYGPTSTPGTPSAPNTPATPKGPAATLPAAMSGAGGCALADGQLFVATSTGKSLASATIAASGKVGNFSAGLTGKYGRLRTVVAGSDGALWLTTSNRDGQGKPVADDDRVIRISAAQGGAASVL